MSPPTQTSQTLLLRVDDAHVKEMNDKFEKVLGNALMAQTVLINYYEDKVGTFQTPHLREKLSTFHNRAQEHQDKLDQMFSDIGTTPSKMKQVMGGMMTKMMEGMANVRGLGADPYPDLQQIMMLEMMSTGAFGLVAQTAAAIGHDAIHEQALSVVTEKFEHWRYLQESAMMYAAVAIFDEKPI